MTDQLVERVRDALRVVIDPELGHNIIDLGFIYDISVVDGAVRITMTATTPGCPAIRFLKEGVANAAARMPSPMARRCFPLWNTSRMISS
jgi:metal-sulfur cluster biosynthetic enzyme